MTTTYDSKCFDLAEDFLLDEPALRGPVNSDKLAGHIQEDIETWIGYEKACLSTAAMKAERTAER